MSTNEIEDEGILYTMAHSRAKLARLRERSRKIKRKLCGSELHLDDREAIEMTFDGLQQGIKDLPFDPSEGVVMQAAMKLVAALLVDFAEEELEEAGSRRAVLYEELDGMVDCLKQEVMERMRDGRQLYLGDHNLDGTDIER